MYIINFKKKNVSIPIRLYTLYDVSKWALVLLDESRTPVINIIFVVFYYINNLIHVYCRVTM